MSAVLVHEACHKRHQYEGIVYPGGLWEEELECYKPSNMVFNLLNPADSVFESRRFDTEFVLARMRATNCFAKISSKEEFYKVTGNLFDHGADDTC